jgi:hypothetical protein
LEAVRPSRNYTGYCNPEVEALIDKQSAQRAPAKRKELVWQVERKLIEDAVRPITFFMRQATCWQPEVKGLTLIDNSIFNSWRMEDVWLDRWRWRGHHPRLISLRLPHDVADGPGVRGPPAQFMLHESTRPDTKET